MAISTVQVTLLLWVTGDAAAVQLRILALASTYLPPQPTRGAKRGHTYLPPLQR